ncbi:MAG: plasmid related protein [Candidatus Sulfotelmatobacter sp.]|nr:plasmid related protein [Candidatus Sulfotelmatobacter sp.]
MNSLPAIPLFPAGQIVATPGALALLEQANQSPLEFLSRHLRGDWGELYQDDKTENELSLKCGFRLMSSYPVTDSERLWIITEADRSVTTLLLPAEY